MAQTGRTRAGRWEPAHETDEAQLVSKLHALSDDGKAQVMRLIDDLLAQERSKRLIREAFEMSERSLARSWGPKDETDPEKDL